MKFLILEIWGALRDLVLFVQFKKREKHPWRSVNFSKIAQRTTYWYFGKFYLHSQKKTGRFKVKNK